jgi:NADH:ubiquinone oxidoreductase subunit 3 (subunit A)
MSDLVLHFVLFGLAGTALVMAPLLIGRLVRPRIHTPEKDAIYECGEPTIGSSYVQFDLRFYTVALLFIVFDVEVAFFFPWASLYGGATQLADQQLSPPARVELTQKVLNVASADGVDGETLKKAYERSQFSSADYVNAKRIALWDSPVLRAEAETDVNENVEDSASLTDEQRQAAIDRALGPLVDAELDNLIIADLAESTDHSPEELKALWISASDAAKLGLVSFADILVFFGVLLVGFAYVWKRGDLDWVRAVGAEYARKSDTDSSESSSAKPELVA